MGEEEIILEHQTPCDCCYVSLDPPIKKLLGGELDGSVLHMRRALRALGEKTDGFRDKLEKRIRKAVKDGRARRLLGRLEGGEKVQQACILEKRRRDLESASKLKDNAKAVRKTHNWVPVSPLCSHGANSLQNMANEMDCNKAVPTMEGRDRNEEATIQRQNTNEAEEEENSTVANEMDTNQKFEVEYQLSGSKVTVKQVNGAESHLSPVENHHNTVNNTMKVKCLSRLQEFGMPVMVSPECPSKPRTNTSAAEIGYHQKPKHVIGGISPKISEEQPPHSAICTVGDPRKASRAMNNVMKLVNQLETRVNNQQKENKTNDKSHQRNSATSTRASDTRHSGRRSETDEKQKSKTMDPEDRESYDMYPVYVRDPTEATVGGDSTSWENGLTYSDSAMRYDSSSLENEFSSSYQEIDILSDDEITKTNTAIEAQYDTRKAGERTSTSYGGGQSQDNHHKGGEEDTDEKLFIPDWARGIALATALDSQFGSPQPQDPDFIFQEIPTCDLERIFERGRKRYAKRTSSGNWKHDKLTIAEKVNYKQDMGYTTMGIVGK